MFDTEFWANIEQFRNISNGELNKLKPLLALALLHWPTGKLEWISYWFDTYQNQVKEIAELEEIIQCAGSPTKLQCFVGTLIFHGRSVFDSVLERLFNQSCSYGLFEIGNGKPAFLLGFEKTSSPRT